VSARSADVLGQARVRLRVFDKAQEGGERLGGGVAREQGGGRVGLRGGLCRVVPLRLDKGVEDVAAVREGACCCFWYWDKERERKAGCARFRAGGERRAERSRLFVWLYLSVCE